MRWMLGWVEGHVCMARQPRPQSHTLASRFLMTMAMLEVRTGAVPQLNFTATVN